METNDETNKPPVVATPRISTHYNKSLINNVIRISNTSFKLYDNDTVLRRFPEIG